MAKRAKTLLEKNKVETCALPTKDYKSNFIKDNMVFMQEEENLIKNRLRGQKQKHTCIDTWLKTSGISEPRERTVFSINEARTNEGIWNRFLLPSLLKQNQLKANQTSKCERKNRIRERKNFLNKTESTKHKRKKKKPWTIIHNFYLSKHTKEDDKNKPQERKISLTHNQRTQILDY